MGRLHFESLSQANYKRMTLISKVSQFEITPVPVWNEGGGAVGVAVTTLFFNNTPRVLHLHKEMEQFPSVMSRMNKQMIISHMIASHQRIAKCYPLMFLSVRSVCTVWCKAAVSQRCPSCCSDGASLCWAWTHKVSAHMEHMAQIRNIWTPTTSTNVIGDN